MGVLAPGGTPARRWPPACELYDAETAAAWPAAAAAALAWMCCIMAVRSPIACMPSGPGPALLATPGSRCGGTAPDAPRAMCSRACCGAKPAAAAAPPSGEGVGCRAELRPSPPDAYEPCCEAPVRRDFDEGLPPPVLVPVPPSELSVLPVLLPGPPEEPAASCAAWLSCMACS